MAKNIVLVGNKVDLSESKRRVSFEEAFRLAKRLNLAGVFETAAKLGDSEAFNLDMPSVDDVFFRSVLNCHDLYGGKTKGNSGDN